MPSSSLIKFVNRCQDNGRGKVFWHRLNEDGLPFRGASAPFFTEEEFEDRLTKVADPKNGVFDITDAEQNTRYLEILDGITNGWFQLIFINRQYDKEKKLVYIEWVEYFLEDGITRAPLPNAREISYGPANGESNPAASS